ncbi:MAG: hypothetical protein EOO06_13775 [Chitinophagaceae bacterium]|nr:MAG: hypothetical protein EOO06_13775 [Chitinophagaceae bacterium]
MNKIFSLLILAGFTNTSLFAQRDTTKTQAIDITSAFKPVLRNAVKINFYGSQLQADTSRPTLNYNIPSQNLFYAYQPISLRPLALAQDTNLYLGGRNFVKAGFGNYSTPYLAAGFSFGDGRKSLVNIYADYIGSKGKDIEFQDYSMLNVKATGSVFTPKNEIYATAFLSKRDYHLYGYDHVAYTYAKSDIKQQLQDIGISVGARNTTNNELGLSYSPSAQINFFSNKDRLNETTITLNVPVEKRIGEELKLLASFKGEFANYGTENFIPNNIKLTNNLVQLAPAVEYNTKLVRIHGGITPVWNNGKFTWMPDIYAEAQLQEKVFMLQAGWVGRFTQNTYRNLSMVNPYLLPLTQYNNTKEVEYYGGIKASLGTHFNFNAKAGLVRYTDLPLFINDTASDEKGFIVSNERNINNFRVHGDISYINQDKFTVNAGLTLNGYTGMKDNAKAWHTLPMEFTSSMRWWAFERFLLKADLYFFNGGKYLVKGNNSKALDGGTDLSAGAEYKINKQFSAWMNVNNILNDKYERWHNYQVYGLNLTGGILIHF